MKRRVRRTVGDEHKSKEGLLKHDGEVIYDDSWMHPTAFDPHYEKYMNFMIRRLRSPKVKKSVFPEDENKGLYLDLNKGNRTMDRSKLIQRRVMVRGKNGKIFYRMQWVDPRTGEPAHGPAMNNVVPENNKPSLKDHVDDTVKRMSREEKYEHLAKHGIKWKRNEHEQIDHKNAVMALKNHFMDNPHLINGEHLPKDDNRTPEGGDPVDEWTKKYKHEEAKLYGVLKHLGIIGPDDTDPRLNPDDKAAPIKHMHNMMKLKKHLRENPHLMDEMDKHQDYGIGGITKKKPKVPSKAQEGGNTIKGIMDNMSRSEKYALAKRLGLAEQDPASNPNVKDHMKAIMHMGIMMKLKKAIEQDPSLLNTDEHGNLSPQEQHRIASLEGDEKLRHEAQETLRKASKDLKTKWADKYEDHEEMQKRTKSDTDNIDHMHKMSALAKILSKSPELLEKFKSEVGQEQLFNYKISNKKLERFLRQVAGFKGVGDVKQVEPGIEWSFSRGFIRKEEDEEGNPILSIVDTGEDQTEWEESMYGLEEVKDFMEGKGKTATPKAIALHRKASPEIWKVLTDAVADGKWDKVFTPQVNDALKDSFRHMFEQSGQSRFISAMMRNSDVNMPLEKRNDFMQAIQNYLEDNGVPVSSYGVIESDTNTDDENLKKLVWGHKITDTKEKNANDYLMPKLFSKNQEKTDTWVLHNSARNWDHNTRMDARKDIIASRTRFDIKGMDVDKDTESRMHHHLNLSLEHMPFDLMTDAFANGGLKMHFNSHYADGKTPQLGSHFDPATYSIVLDPAYVRSDKMSAEHPADFIPDPVKLNNKGDKYVVHSFATAAVHEFAHALDNYLSGKTGFSQWGDNKMGKKYVPEKYQNLVPDAYDKAVAKSNPKKLVGLASTGNDKYLYHLDEWISNYEGRIYDQDYYKAGSGNIAGNKKDGFHDANWKDGYKKGKGLEHWSESVDRYANAVHYYKRWKQETGDESTSMADWSEQKYKEFMHMGYGDASNAVRGKIPLRSYIQGLKDDPDVGYGYLYHRMRKSNPLMRSGIESILGRGDFLNEKGPSIRSLAERGEYSRKSEVSLIIEG